MIKRKLFELYIPKGEIIYLKTDEAGGVITTFYAECLYTITDHAGKLIYMSTRNIKIQNILTIVKKTYPKYAYARWYESCGIVRQKNN